MCTLRLGWWGEMHPLLLNPPLQIGTPAQLLMITQKLKHRKIKFV